jgi:hypothetical protein
MKRTLILAVTSVVALATASYAVAHGSDGSKTAKAVAGTFNAATASRVNTRTCTTSEGKTIVTTDGTYAGAALGDADLAGAATLHAKSTINTTDGVGVVSGSIKIDVASGSDTRADFSTVYQGGHIAGLAAGRAHDPSVKLLANFSADFSASAGFTNGKIGGGTAGGIAVELGPSRCEKVRVVKETSEAKGLVTAVSATSITVAGLTCVVPASLQSAIAGLTVGSRAEIRCSFQNGANTLVSAKKR